MPDLAGWLQIGATVYTTSVLGGATFYDRRKAIDLKAKDSVIETKDSMIASLNRQIEEVNKTKDERLSAKEDHIKAVERDLALTQKLVSKTFMDDIHSQMEYKEKRLTELKAQTEMDAATIKGLKETESQLKQTLLGFGDTVRGEFALKMVDDMKALLDRQASFLTSIIESRDIQLKLQEDALRELRDKVGELENDPNKKQEAENAYMDNLIREMWQELKGENAENYQTLSVIRECWDDIKQELKKPGTLPTLSLLEKGELSRVTDGKLLIGFRNMDDREAWDRGTHGASVAKAVRDVAGFDLEVHGAIFVTLYSEAIEKVPSAK